MSMGMLGSMSGQISQTANQGIGAQMGAITGYIAARAQKKASRTLKKRITRGIGLGEGATARQVAGILSSPEFLTATRFMRGLYGIQGDPRADLYSSLTTAFGSEALQNQRFTNELDLIRGRFGMSSEQNPIFTQAATGLAARAAREGEFLAGGGWGQDARAGLLNAGAAMQLADVEQQAGQYGQVAQAFEGAPGPMDTLTQDFIKGVRQAQSSRGLYSSQAGAAAEASGLAAFRARLQLENIPLLMEMAAAPVNYGQRYMGGNLQTEVFRSTGGQAVYGQPSPYTYGGMGTMVGVMQGAGAGAMAGSAMGSAGGGGGGGGAADYGVQLSQLMNR